MERYIVEISKAKQAYDKELERCNSVLTKEINKLVETGEWKEIED